MGVGDWLRRLLGGSARPPALPAGFTDDLSVPLPPGRTPEQVVDFVLAAHQEGQDHPAVVAAVAAEFRLTAEDAELAIDRVGGGMTRAMTGNPDNCPTGSRTRSLGPASSGPTAVVEADRPDDPPQPTRPATLAPRTHSSTDARRAAELGPSG